VLEVVGSGIIVFLVPKIMVKVFQVPSKILSLKLANKSAKSQKTQETPATPKEDIEIQKDKKTPIGLEVSVI